MDSIINHIKYKFSVEPFDFLNLKFFGGEPILRPKIIVELVSNIKALAVEYGFKLHVHFTTNGTIIPESLLQVLQECDSSFQITIDGNQSSHDSTRIRKVTGKENGTYHIILNNISRICAQLEQTSVIVRINFSNETLNGLNSLIDDLDFCDRKKVSISLHKVWQVDSNSIDKSLLFNFISYANSRRFLVNFMILKNHKGCICYADRYNQAVINYDGKVYKCTARDFNDDNSEGSLCEEGFIDWRTDRLMDRMSIRITENCKKCKLLPSCPGICSQNRLEKKGQTLCALDDDFTEEDYIIHNFNYKILKTKIETS